MFVYDLGVEKVISTLARRIPTSPGNRQIPQISAITPGKFAPDERWAPG